jgi:hypothetical protein
MEYVSNKKFLSKEGVYLEYDNNIIFKKQAHLFLFLRLKTGNNKAALAELFIKIIKRKIYLSLRSGLTTSWSDNLAQIVKNYNSTPNRAIGYLKPGNITSPTDGPLIDGALKEQHLAKKPEPHFDAHFILSKAAKEKIKELLPGKFVILDLPAKVMNRSFDLQVSVKSGSYLLL